MYDKKIASITVFYRKIPEVLENLINKDRHMGMMKDGLQKHDSHLCPRLTIFIHTFGDDRKRVKGMSDLLETLLKTNQIVHYNIRAE